MSTKTAHQRPSTDRRTLARERGRTYGSRAVLKFIAAGGADASHVVEKAAALADEFYLVGVERAELRLAFRAGYTEAWNARTPEGWVLGRIAEMHGARLRLTWPNGSQRVGTVQAWNDWSTFDGDLIGGEVDSVARIERMGATGRYETLWAAAGAPLTAV